MTAPIVPAADSACGAVGHGHRLRALDGWRAISIALVVGGHLWNYHALEGRESHAVRYVSVFGVQIFFVISGFLITTLALDERSRFGRFSPLAFYGRRVFRILPAYFAYLVALAALARAGALAGPLDLAAAARFSCNLVECGWFVGHTWSLAYEQQFYLLFPLLLMLPAAPAALIAVVQAGLVAALLVGAFVVGPQATPAIEFAFHFAYIGAGVLLAAHRPAAERLAAADRHGIVTLVAIAVCLAALALLAPGSIANRFEPAHARAIEAALVPPSIAWLVWRTTVSDGLVTRLLDLPPLRFVGRLSYSLYLWQQLFTGASAATHHAAWATPWAMLPAAWLSYVCIEQPLMRLGNRLCRPRTPKPSVD